jgi:hypothetical protein
MSTQEERSSGHAWSQAIYSFGIGNDRGVRDRWICGAGRDTKVRAFAMRLRRLEERLVPEIGIESEQTRRLRASLEAARLRCGFPPPSPERLAQLRTMTIPEILNAARQRLVEPV